MTATGPSRRQNRRESPPGPRPFAALARLGTPGANLSDREFLAPALEILETPPSPVHVAFLWIICAFVLAALVWAYLGRVDIVAAAQGKLQPAGRVKVVEPMETGRVETSVSPMARWSRQATFWSSSTARRPRPKPRARAPNLPPRGRKYCAGRPRSSRREAHRFDSPPKIDWPDDVAPALRERELRVLAADLGAIGCELSLVRRRARRKRPPSGTSSPRPSRPRRTSSRP